MFEVLSLTFIALLGVMSPGPDFAIVTRYALAGSRRGAMLAALGISLACLVHVTYCSLGIALLLAESPVAFRVIQIIGSFYLGYLGIRLLIPSKTSTQSTHVIPRRAFLTGLLTNLLNPKATLFILSLFTQFVKPDTSIWMIILYAFIISGTALAWFSGLAFLITHHYFLPHFARFQKVLMKIMGVMLLLLALWVLSQLQNSQVR